MHLIHSKLTSKNQATVPKEVREILHLQPKDYIIYEIQEDQTVVLRKAKPIDIEYLEALSYTLSEWNSPADEEAYKYL